MQLRMGCAIGWGQSAWDVRWHWGRAKTMPTAGSRYNRPDADAIAHGMSNRVGAGPTPTAWRCAAASGQGEQPCQKQAVETTVPRMRMQLRMGCASAWGQGQGEHACIRAGPATVPKTAYRHNCAQSADAIAHGMCNRMGQSAWDVQRHRSRAKTRPTAGSRYSCAWMQMHFCAWDESPGGGRANTYRMEMRSFIGARRTTMPKTGCGNNRSGCRCNCAWDMQPHGDRASTSRMGGRICIRAGPASMPETAYRHNCARDADAIAHGMRATRWRQSAWDAQRHYMGQGKHHANSRF